MQGVSVPPACRPAGLTAKGKILLTCALHACAATLLAVSIYATGQVLHQTHDWALVFEAAAGLYTLGARAYRGCASCEEQFCSEGAKAAAPAGKGIAAKTKLQ